MAATGEGRELTRKQRAFVEEYLRDVQKPVAECVLAAGYKTKNPHVIGNQLLKIPLVQRAIEEKRAELERDLRVDRRYVIKGLQQIADECRTAAKWDPGAANRALELLGKTKGMFIDKKEMSGQITVTTRLEELMGGAERPEDGE